MIYESMSYFLYTCFISDCFSLYWDFLNITKTNSRLRIDIHE